jgi:hypothetical protein
MTNFPLVKPLGVRLQQAMLVDPQTPHTPPTPLKLHGFLGELAQKSLVSLTESRRNMQRFAEAQRCAISRSGGLWKFVVATESSSFSVC